MIVYVLLNNDDSMVSCTKMMTVCQLIKLENKIVNVFLTLSFNICFGGLNEPSH